MGIPHLPSKPRVVVVGAGIAGLSAAHRLHRYLPPAASFDLLVLEASDRIGGRICTASIAGDLVELGATWIHGIEGSPVYEIAQRIGSLEGDVPWERHDGFPGDSVLRAEGGCVVDRSLVEPVIDVYEKAMSEVRAMGERKNSTLLQQHVRESSVGSFMRQALHSFFSNSSSEIDDIAVLPYERWNNHVLGGGEGFGRRWNLRALQESAFSMLEDIDRIDSASSSLHDLDLDSEKEYEVFPGPHVTIGKGYMSVLNELASGLPNGTIRFGKKVEKMFWNHAHPSSSAPVVIFCEDGSVIEAEHVILTMSLGILKAGTSLVPSQDPTADITTNRSVHELRGRVPNEGNARQLFEPPLPLWKLKSISRLGFGVVDKLFLEVEPSFESRLRAFTQLLYHRDSAKDGSIPWWMRRTVSICPIYGGSNVLLCWFAGAEALEMEGLSDDEIIDGVAQTLAKFGLGEGAEEEEALAERKRVSESSDSEESSEDGEVGNTIAFVKEKKNLRNMFRGVLRSKWASNSLCQGSYAFVAAGSNGLDIEALAEPLPKCRSIHRLSPLSEDSLSSQDEDENELGPEAEDQDHHDQVCRAQTSPLELLFAGEATHRQFYSTTHGAFLSGAREADRLIQLYESLLSEP